jgi:hypothetical protein
MHSRSSSRPRVSSHSSAVEGSPSSTASTRAPQQLGPADGFVDDRHDVATPVLCDPQRVDRLLEQPHHPAELVVADRSVSPKALLSAPAYRGDDLCDARRFRPSVGFNTLERTMPDDRPLIMRAWSRSSSGCDSRNWGPLLNIKDSLRITGNLQITRARKQPTGFYG